MERVDFAEFLLELVEIIDSSGLLPVFVAKPGAGGVTAGIVWAEIIEDELTTYDDLAEALSGVPTAVVGITDGGPFSGVAECCLLSGELSMMAPEKVMGCGSDIESTIARVSLGCARNSDALVLRELEENIDSSTAVELFRNDALITVSFSEGSIEIIDSSIILELLRKEASAIKSTFDSLTEKDVFRNDGSSSRCCSIPVSAVFVVRFRFVAAFKVVDSSARIDASPKTLSNIPDSNVLVVEVKSVDRFRLL